jgi:oxygen-independent coproporphyrinogen III oxidase
MTESTTRNGAPGLYLHIPFCSAVCPYCDFSVMRLVVAARKRFVDHLVAEVVLAAREWSEPRPFDTVYLGGGTPSLLPAEDLARILGACRQHLPLAAAPWILLEANPEDVTPEACAAWRHLGVRTLSLGVQSFSDDALRFLGRRHDAQQARAAVEAAQAASFDTVSVDLIFGLPDQTPEIWQRDLEAAVALRPGHVSCYQLTIHPRTRFGVSASRGQLSELPEEQQADLFELTHHFLADAGWPAYEVSNFARSNDHKSRHNRKYWDHTPYLGLGPSAHSLAMPDASASGTAARRWWNELRTPRWEQRVAAGERPVEAEELLGPKALATETLMLGLRTTAGIDLDDFVTRYGFDLLAANDALVARLVAESRLAVLSGPDGRRLLPTLSGLAVADSIAAAFDLPLPASLP